MRDALDLILNSMGNQIDQSDVQEVNYAHILHTKELGNLKTLF